MRGALLLLFALACDAISRRTPTDVGPVDFNLSGMSFHISDGAAVNSGGALTFYLSDQPNACAAFRNVPVGTATTLSLRVVPQADGTTRASVVAKPVPSAGEATGGIVRATGGVKNASLDASSGSVAWTLNSDGSYTLGGVDVGFAGTADRLVTWGLTLAPCAP
jgi:hypothetical protein